jgi:hypothetical protein
MWPLHRRLRRRRDATEVIVASRYGGLRCGFQAAAVAQQIFRKRPLLCGGGALG